MYLILRITLKLNNNNDIEYMGHTIYDKNNDLWCACKIMERGAEECLRLGYHVVQETTTNITLQKSATWYERYCIIDE